MLAVEVSDLCADDITRDNGTNAGIWGFKENNLSMCKILSSRYHYNKMSELAIGGWDDNSIVI